MTNVVPSCDRLFPVILIDLTDGYKFAKEIDCAKYSEIYSVVQLLYFHGSCPEKFFLHYKVHVTEIRKYLKLNWERIVAIINETVLDDGWISWHRE